MSHCGLCAPLPDYEAHEPGPRCAAHRTLPLCHSRAHRGIVDRGQGPICLACDRPRCKRRHDGKYEDVEVAMDENANREQALPAAPAADEPTTQEEPAATAAPPGPKQVTLSDSEAAIFNHMMRQFQITIAGHEITHEVLGQIVRFLATGKRFDLSPATLQAIGVRPEELLIVRM